MSTLRITKKSRYRILRITALTRLVMFLLILLLISCESSGKPREARPPAPQLNATHAQKIFLLNGPWIGLTVIDSQSGTLLVDDVYWHSPAHTAGIKKNDRILQVNGHHITAKEEYISAIKGLQPNQPAVFSIQRSMIKLSTPTGEHQLPLPAPTHKAKTYEDLMRNLKPGTQMTITASLDSTTQNITMTPVAMPTRLLKYYRTLMKPDQSTQRRSEPGWLGVGLKNINPIPHTPETDSRPLVQISFVYPNSPAYRAGLQEGDILLSMDKQSFTGSATARESLIKLLRTRQKGDRVLFSLLRQTTTLTNEGTHSKIQITNNDIQQIMETHVQNGAVTLNIAKTYQSLLIPVTLGSRGETENYANPDSWNLDQLHPHLANYQSPLQKIAMKAMELKGIKNDYEDLIQRYRKDEEWDDGYRLREFRYLRLHPFQIPKINGAFSDNLKRLTVDNAPQFHELLDSIAKIMDEPYTKRTATLRPQLKTSLSLELHAQQIKHVFAEALKHRNQAFRALTLEQITYLATHLQGFATRYIRDFHLSNPNERTTRGSIDIKVLSLLRLVNFSELYEAASITSLLINPVYTEGLRRDLINEAQKNPTEAILYQTSSAFGPIIFGGSTNQTYKDPAAFIADIAGDEHYMNAMASSRSIEYPFSVIIDFNGHDVYSSSTDGAQGSGFMGVGILADLAGNDRYTAQRHAQGSGLVGVGILYDAAGDDTYKGQEYVQGSGFFGVGIHIDAHGDDTYTANLFAQGFGGVKSFGLLANGYGDDSYYASGKYPSSYTNDLGTFNGFSQGCGTGIRCYADWSMSRSGGIGALLDGAGKDRYEAGTFSQGGGYFFGWGMLSDYGTGNDTYTSTRYGQGFSAHSAIGYFMEEGGDDIHRSVAGVHSGLSWDLTCTVFIEKEGNDVYEGGGFSRGASAHNAFTLFHEMGGNDTYNGPVAVPPYNSYHGGSSFTLFIDADGGTDSYTDKHTNNMIEMFERHGLFIDMDGTVPSLLSSSQEYDRFMNRLRQ